MEQQPSTLENLVNKKLFGNKYYMRKVLVTGHSGFKGAWLYLWLKQMGAEVCGISLKPATYPSLFEVLHGNLESETDITNFEAVKKLFTEFQPEIVFHLAAQAIVQDSYIEPQNTFLTNIQGTVNVLEACRQTASVKAVVVVTSDKCYQNSETEREFAETDPLGGNDPYSASKAAAEMVTHAYRASFFAKPDRKIYCATARAGNVIGGGDWAEYRIIPDMVKAISAKTEFKIRNPNAIRPWQHVLDSLSAYLHIGQKLWEGKPEFEGAWNFGPENHAYFTVEKLVAEFSKHWKAGNIVMGIDSKYFSEAKVLKLDSSKAKRLLNRQSVWNFSETVERTACWYKKFYTENTISCANDLHLYIEKAKKLNLNWATGEI